MPLKVSVDIRDDKSTWWNLPEAQSPLQSPPQSPPQSPRPCGYAFDANALGL
jgi:hypothetical protein